MDNQASFGTYVQVCNLQTQLQKLHFFAKIVKAKKKNTSPQLGLTIFANLRKKDTNPNSSKEEDKSLARTCDFCNFCESYDFLR